MHTLIAICMFACMNASTSIGTGPQPRPRVVVCKPSPLHPTMLARLILSLSRAQAGYHCPRFQAPAAHVAKDVRRGVE
jgi:hypothetical protein